MIALMMEMNICGDIYQVTEKIYLSLDNQQKPTVIPPEVSRLGFTRWVPGSCLPHPRMACVDWSTLA